MPATNHVHLLITPAREFGISRVMQDADAGRHGIAPRRPRDYRREDFLQYFRCVQGGISSRLVATGNNKPVMQAVFHRKLQHNSLNAVRKMRGRHQDLPPVIHHMRFVLPALFLLLAVLHPVQAGQTDPQQVLQEITDRLIEEIHRDPQRLQNVGQVRLLAERYILPHIDFQAAGKLALGKHWRTASEQQRKRFVEEFRALLLHTYLRPLIDPLFPAFFNLA
jgi:hypothetical protein